LVLLLRLTSSVNVSGFAEPRGVNTIWVAPESVTDVLSGWNDPVGALVQSDARNCQAVAEKVTQ
jgi:hypothetical protein